MMWRHQDLSPLFRLHLFAILVSEFSSPTISTRVVDAQLCNIIFSQHHYTIYIFFCIFDIHLTMRGRGESLSPNHLL